MFGFCMNKNAQRDEGDEHDYDYDYSSEIITDTGKLLYKMFVI